ncbi:MAG: Ubiquinone biosynthesis monooxygenase UbiB, partial [uncultured Acidimicrobiales bacterium]
GHRSDRPGRHRTTGVGGRHHLRAPRPAPPGAAPPQGPQRLHRARPHLRQGRPGHRVEPGPVPPRVARGVRVPPGPGPALPRGRGPAHRGGGPRAPPPVGLRHLRRRADRSSVHRPGPRGHAARRQQGGREGAATRPRATGQVGPAGAAAAVRGARADPADRSGVASRPGRGLRTDAPRGDGLPPRGRQHGADAVDPRPGSHRRCAGPRGAPRPRRQAGAHHGADRRHPLQRRGGDAGGRPRHPAAAPHGRADGDRGRPRARVLPRRPPRRQHQRAARRHLRPLRLRDRGAPHRVGPGAPRPVPDRQHDQRLRGDDPSPRLVRLDPRGRRHPGHGGRAPGALQAVRRERRAGGAAGRADGDDDPVDGAAPGPHPSRARPAVEADAVPRGRGPHPRARRRPPRGAEPHLRDPLRQVPGARHGPRGGGPTRSGDGRRHRQRPPPL